MPFKEIHAYWLLAIAIVAGVPFAFYLARRWSSAPVTAPVSLFAIFGVSIVVATVIAAISGVFGAITGGGLADGGFKGIATAVALFAAYALLTVAAIYLAGSHAKRDVIESARDGGKRDEAHSTAELERLIRDERRRRARKRREREPRSPLPPRDDRPSERMADDDTTLDVAQGMLNFDGFAEDPDQLLVKNEIADRMRKRRSLAVALFVNENADEEESNFSRGIAAKIADALLKAGTIRVFEEHNWLEARFLTSEESGESPSDIADLDVAGELGIDFFVKGTYRQSIFRLVFNIQVVDGDDGGEVWAQSFDIAVEDLSSTIPKIRDDILAALGLPEAVSATDFRQTTSPDRLWKLGLAERIIFEENGVARDLLPREEYVRAREILSEILEMDSESVVALRDLALVLMAGRGDVRQAVTLLRKAVSLAPYSPEYRFALAQILAKLDEIAQAADAYNDCLSLDPAFIEARIELGRLYMRSNRAVEAIKQFRLAVETAPQYAPAYLELGKALLAHGDLDAALESLRGALKLAPDFADAHLALGDVLRKKNDYGGAMTAYKEAIRIDPNLCAAYYNLGVLLQETKHHREAVEIYRDLVAIDPNNSAAYNNLGAALGETGDLYSAIKAFKDAIAISPTQADLHDNLGLAYYQKGLLDKAQAEFFEAIRLDPRYSPTYFNMACYFSRQGERDAALRNLKTAVSLDKTYKEKARKHADFKTIRDLPQFKRLVSE